MAVKDYYEILGLSEHASPDEIRMAYRRLAKKYHPDANQGNTEAVGRFKEVSEAYEVLGEPGRRREYDQARKAVVSGLDPQAVEEFFRQAEARSASGAGAAAPGPDDKPAADGAAGAGPAGKPGAGSFFEDLGMGGLGDLFQQIFKSPAEQPGAGPQRGENLTQEVELTFEEAQRGGEKVVTLAQDLRCELCRGSGAKPNTPRIKCANCDGQGHQTKDQGGFAVSRPCRKCLGRGYLVTVPCPGCGGKGQERKEQKLSVPIPKGAQDGQKRCIPKRGKPGTNGGPPGDLILVLRVRDSDRFRREEDAVVTRVQINVAQAMLGCKLPVKLLDGLVEISIPAGTQSGQKLRVKGRGLPLEEGRRGDVIVEVTVRIPRASDDAARNAVQKMAQELGLDVEPGKASER